MLTRVAREKALREEVATTSCCAQSRHPVKRRCLSRLAARRAAAGPDIVSAIDVRLSAAACSTAVLIQRYFKQRYFKQRYFKQRYLNQRYLNQRYFNLSRLRPQRRRHRPDARQE